MDKRIICVGGVTVDKKIKSIHPLQLSTSNPVSSISSFGGVAHNVAKNLSLLTDNIYIHSAVGDDSDGQRILHSLNAIGINTQPIHVIRHKPTAHYDVILDTNGEVFIALADMEIFDEIPYDLFTQECNQWCSNDIIFLDTNLPSAIIEYIIMKCQSEHITLCIDPVSVAKTKKLPTHLDNVFILKPDRYEAEALTNISINTMSDCIKAGEMLVDRGVINCIITLGKAGYVIVNQSIQKHYPSIFTNHIVDASGAGDAFVSGILYEIKNDASIVEACQLGAAAATMTLQSYQTVNESITLSTLKKLQSDLVSLESESA